MPEYFFHLRFDTGPEKCNANGNLQRTNVFATPPVLAGATSKPQHQGSRSLHPPTDDWRSGQIVLQSVDMIGRTSGTTTPRAANSAPRTPSALSKHITNSPGTAPTKARFEPTDTHESEVGWGVVRVFRDVEETPGLGDGESTQTSSRASSSALQRLSLSTPTSSPATKHASEVKDEECTTLCILAVPSYMSPADFMGWVGDKTRDEVSHFRLIKTERLNRYMVLMRFRSGRRAREWRKEWNGASFDAAVPETAHVVFVKSIEFLSEQNASFPDIADPFTTKAADPSSKSAVPNSLSASLKAKPPAPPTPNLIEMPTCPVCLERMDETTGLLTIQCQHVFHCTCLHKWKGSGCPVCRFTHGGPSGRRAQGSDDPDSGPNECSICRSDNNLWICLICGNIGCGRYDAAHAFMHWQHSGHSFSMDMTTQRIWDYAGDAYVHRIVQNKLDGKIMEAPEAGPEESGTAEGKAYNGEEGYVAREKSDAIGREYTALLTSQLESQRAYFEEKISLAADKASQASLAATQATEAASRALDQTARLQEEHEQLLTQTIPSLERDRDRATKRADKAQEMARKFEKEWREEKAVNEGLLERVKKLDAEFGPLKAENADLKEMNRDLQFFISSQEKIKEMGDEAADGSVSLPEEKKKGRKGKKKATNA